MRVFNWFLPAVALAAHAVVCAAQAPGDLTLKIPSVKTQLNLEGQPVEITAWGTVASSGAGTFRIAMTADLGNFQENLTALMAAQLNRSDRCGERLSVERAVLVPKPPSALLTVNVHYERYTCVKALGKELVKRLVGGNGVVEVGLTPSVGQNRIALAAETREIDADGSLGEVLRSGSLGESLRQKIAASIESAVQKSASFPSALPAEVGNGLTLQAVQFADGGDQKLWLTTAGEVRLPVGQFRALSKLLAK